MKVIISTQAVLKMVFLTEPEQCSIRMVTNMKVNGKIVKNTGRDCTLIQTRTITTENGTRTMQKEREYPLSTVFISLEHLAKAKSMEWVN